MCLELSGEVRDVLTVKTKKGDLDILKVLAKVGKSERFFEIANFSNKVIEKGKCKLSVVPSLKNVEGRSFLNWATYEV